jgi:uncharacterized membrane protein
MPGPSNEELAERLRALSIEVVSLRDEVERLKGGRSPLPSAPAFFPAADPLSSSAPTSPVAAPTSPAPSPSTPPAPAPRPPWLLPKPGERSKPAERQKPWLVPKSPARAKPAWTLDEKFIGEKLTQYAGMVVLALGIVFFLIWTAAHAGPEVRVAIAAAAGAALILLGSQAAKRPPYDGLSGTLIGGGWTVLYLTIYAAYHFDATKIIDSATLELGLLLAAAGGLTAHALSRRSRPLRLYAVGLTYFVMLVCGRDVPAFELFLILFAAAAAVAVETGEADVLIASLLGYYANYASVYVQTINIPPAQRTLDNFAAPFAWLAIPYALVAVLPLIPYARRRVFETDEGRALGDAALSLNAVLFAVTAGSMGRIYFGVPQLARAAGLSLLFAVPSLLHARALSRRSTAAGLSGVLALGLLAAAVFEMPDPMWKLLAWIVISCAWVWVGLLFDQPVWRAAGLVSSVLTFGFYIHVAAEGPESRRAASMALFLFAGLSYFFSRFHRLWLESPEEWEKPATELWLHAGSLALLVGLWGVLDAAPFLCVLVALALAAEHVAVRLGRAHLWAQASLLQCGACVYSLFVDYGADAPVAGLTPRLWTTAVLAAGSAYAYFDGPADEELTSRWTHWSRAQARRGLSWLAVLAVSFAAYREFDGRLRLPIWALGCLGLLALGRVRRDEDFRRQGGILAVVAGVEAFATYLLAPPQLLSPLSAWSMAFYWGSCAALLAGLFVVKSRRWGAPTELDDQAARALGFLPIVLGACYLAKELDRVQLTMAWTGLGLAALIGGLAFDWRELRYPGLGLLGVCVVKALIMDTAGLPLPYRVASFVGLGVVLLLASSLYAKAGARAPLDEKNPPADPG